MSRRPDTSWARRRPARAIRSLNRGAVLRVVRNLWAPTTVEGLDRLDGTDGPVVVVANHTSHADTMVLLTSLPRRLRRRLVVAAAADYFFKGGVSGFFSSLLFGAIPVDRQGVSRSTLEECHQLLGSGWSLLIYPEGGRSPDGEMQPFKPGAAWIARRAGVPVVPVHLEGVYDVLPKGRSWPRRHAVTVTIGEPMRVRPDEDARAFNRRVQARVEELGAPSSTAVDVPHAAQRDEAV